MEEAQAPHGHHRVHADGFPATGRVKVRVGGNTLTAAVRDGVAKVRLPKVSKARKTVTVSYAGDRNHVVAKTKRAIRVK